VAQQTLRCGSACAAAHVAALSLPQSTRAPSKHALESMRAEGCLKAQPVPNAPPFFLPMNGPCELGMRCGGYHDTVTSRKVP
jgi:hypothetical protein